MDIFFDLILENDIDLNNYGFEEILIYWGDEKFSHTPPKYRTEENLIFIKNTSPPSYDKLLPIIYSQYNVFSLADQSIYTIEKLVNSGLPIGDNQLTTFIRKRLPLFNSWAVVLSLDEDVLDGITNILEITDETQLVLEIERSVNWKSGEGFIAFKNLE
ncbi:hypothetical protein ACUN4K_06465 [Hafnia alvei]|uniref:hypothetical protein n=1 Tax=Hafnia alvei TaxID=569 RepID=UPI0040455DD9